MIPIQRIDLLCPECYSLSDLSTHGDFRIKFCNSCNWYQIILYGPQIDFDINDDGNFTLELTKQEAEQIYNHFKESSDSISQALVKKIAFYVLNIYQCQ